MTDVIDDRLEGALSRLDEDGRFDEQDVDDLRALADRALTSPKLADTDPEKVFGPWSELPGPAKTYLRKWCEGEIRGAMAFYPRGRLWPAAVRGLLAQDRALAEKERLPGIQRACQSWAGHLWRRPRMVREAFKQTSAFRRWKRERRPFLGDFLVALGKDPGWVMSGFAEGIRVDPRCRGYYHDLQRNVAWGYILGIDLVPTASGVICHEANLNAGFFSTTRKGYWDQDPVPIGLADLARESGFRKIVWFHGDAQPMEPWFHSQLWDGITGAGLDFELLEDTRLPIRDDVPAGLPIPRRALFPPVESLSDCLVVRARDYRVGPDLLLTEKESFARSFRPEILRTGENRVKILPLTRFPEEVTLPDDQGVPNLVYKYPTSGKGKGVFFLRARDREHALVLGKEIDARTGHRGGLFQRWVSSEFLPGRRIFEYRAVILVTPVGIRYLGIRRRETVHAIPESVSEGILADRKPFIITGYFDNVSVPTMGTEEPPLKDAALALGETLSRVLTRVFVTSG